MPETASLQLAKQLIAQASVTPDDHGCQEIIAERTGQISDLMNAIKAQKGEYQQKIAKLKAYNATLNS